MLVISFSFIRSLKVLAPFSLAANIITIGGKKIEKWQSNQSSYLSLGLIIIMQYIVRDHIPLNELPLITPPSNWPVFFASAMYVFEGIGLVCIE